MSNFLKIGIDIDNVISDSAPLYLRKFNETFGTTVSYEKMKSYWFTQKATGIPQIKIEKFFAFYLEDMIFQVNLPPVTGALTVIKNWLNRGYKIHYITARPKESENATRIWLQKHSLMNSYSTLDHFYPEKYENDRFYKRQKSKIFGVDLFIEDSYEIVLELDVPVLLLDKPWNQGKLKKNIQRVKDWPEIDRLVSRF